MVEKAWGSIMRKAKHHVNKIQPLKKMSVLINRRRSNIKNMNKITIYETFAHAKHVKWIFNDHITFETHY